MYAAPGLARASRPLAAKRRAEHRFGFCFGFCFGSLTTVRQREVYLNAPIVLVAVEIRHTLCEPIDASAMSKIGAALSDVLPLRGEVQSVTLAFQPGGLPVQQQGTFPRWSSRDKRTALTIRSDALVVETSNYRQYENLRGLVELALAARIPSTHAVGIERIGLRYIDEIRVPTDNGDSTTTWSQWVDQSLVGPVVAPEDALGLRLSEHQGVAVFLGEQDQTLVLRYGPREGYAIASTSELRRSMPAPGPFFLLDIDSFWQPLEVSPTLERDTVLNKIDELHVPVREMFETLITDRLRNEVLRGE